MTNVRTVPTSMRLRDRVWAAWPWLNWGTPISFILIRFAGHGGWETLFLLIASPVLVPVIGLLASLPRFILRRRGQRTAPGPIPALLFVHWWAWIALALTLQGAGDSGALPSLLDDLVAAPLAPWFQQNLLAVAALVAVLSWVAVLICACTMTAETRRDPWRLTTIIAAVAVPVVLVATVWGGAVASTQSRDAAGETHAQVSAMSSAERTDRAVQRYDDAQRTLAGVRALIADDGWGTDRIDAGGYRGACSRELELCYHFRLSYFLDESPDIMDDLADLLRSAGWRVDVDGVRDDRRYVSATDDEGNEVVVYRYDGKPIRVDFTTPAWWDGEERIASRMRDDGIDLDARYAADEWPPAP